MVGRDLATKMATLAKNREKAVLGKPKLVALVKVGDTKCGWVNLLK